MKKLGLVTSKFSKNLLKEKGFLSVTPLKDFSIGFTYDEDIEDIKEGFIYINRVLDSSSIESFKKLLKKVNKNVLGFIFQDVGLIEVLKDTSFKKILFNPHFNCNYRSINEFFKYVDDIILPLDITEDEIDEIILKTTKKVSLFVFGLIPSMYSRRYLITSYNKHFSLDDVKEKDIHVNNEKFISLENKYGTLIYHYPYFDGTSLLKKDVNYLFYAPVLFDDDSLVSILDNDFSKVETDTGFLYKKTIYKLKEDK